MTNTTPEEITASRMGAPIAGLRVPRGMDVKEFLALMNTDYAAALELSRKANEVALANMIGTAATAAQG